MSEMRLPKYKPYDVPPWASENQRRAIEKANACNAARHGVWVQELAFERAKTENPPKKDQSAER